MTIPAQKMNFKNQAEILAFIRQRLAFDDFLVSQFRCTDTSNFKKEHRRFEMSGTTTKPGKCVVFNMGILNLFADLGFYEQVDYLFVNFYKGDGKIYLRYFDTKESVEIDVSGYGTVEIIYEIFMQTIFTDHKSKDI